MCPRRGTATAALRLGRRTRMDPSSHRRLRPSLPPRSPADRFHSHTCVVCCATCSLYAVQRVPRSRPSFAANVLVCNLLPAPCRGFCCMVRDTRRMVSHTLRLLVPIRAVRCILRRGPFVRLSSTASRSIDGSILAFVEKPWTNIPSAQMMSPTCTAAARVRGNMPRQCSSCCEYKRESVLSECECECVFVCERLCARARV